MIVIAAAARAAGADPPTPAQPLRASWTALPLAEVAAQATRFSGVPIVVDRRIDPSTRITLDTAGEAIDAVAANVAAQAGADVAILATTRRIAPAAAAAACEEAERLRDAELRRLPAAQRRRLETASAWTWERGAKPRDLVAEAARASGIDIAGLEAIPYDHFPAATWPPLPLAERLDLVLAHFDQRIAWTPGAAGQLPRGRVVPQPLVPAGRPRNRPRPQRPAVPASAGAAPRFTLRVEAPLDDVLAVVGRQLAVAIDIDEPSLQARGVSPRSIVRAEVADASRDRLLEAITGPLGLSWAIDGDRLRVWAPPAQ